MKKIASVIGARPQFIKLSQIHRELARHNDVRHLVIHTGQHFDRDMFGVFFDELGLPEPDYDLHVNSLPHGAMTGRMLEAIESALIRESPDMVLVYGDTNSTLAGALAARKLGLNVGHIEAGLRCFDMRVPEEVNRVVTDAVSSMLFCPTEIAIENLNREGYVNNRSRVVRSGDVMFDAALHFESISSQRSDIVSRLKLDEFVLCTVHRAGNTDDPARLRGIIDGLERISAKMRVVFPAHPRTIHAIRTCGIKTPLSVIDPVGFFDMISLLKHCLLVVTDSGGLQKEAYFYRKPCITLRSETEWVELVKCGCSFLVGADPSKIVTTFESCLTACMDFEGRLYGDGNARKVIIDELIGSLANSAGPRTTA
jgi:UDP-GlcNAc3NAcA epimerase